MAERNNLKELKRVAKDLARRRQIPLNEAQNEVATLAGFPHWAALAKKVKSGHDFTDEQIAEVNAKTEGVELYPQQGCIEGHPYHLCESLGDVILHGRGWRVVVFEAPSATPLVSITDKRIARNPISDPSFVETALRMALWKAEQVRAKIAQDWPRRSTKPDANGFVTHPISKDRSDVWYCLHCDAKTSGRDIALNFWHCPKCEATPIDIFSFPFWLSPLEEENRY